MIVAWIRLLVDEHDKPVFAWQVAAGIVASEKREAASQHRSPRW
ncbi:MAG: hypothetical protein ACREOH_16495 [Candidatus Entotheonellia bacterium]